MPRENGHTNGGGASSSSSLSGDDEEVDVERRRLALYSKCADCVCLGYRLPCDVDELDEEEADAHWENAAKEHLFAVDPKELMAADYTTPCRICPHGLNRHLVEVEKKPKEEIQHFVLVSKDVEKMHRAQDLEDDAHARQVMHQAFQLLLESIRYWRAERPIPFGVPPFEQLSIYNLIYRFVATQEDVDEISDKVELATKLLSIINTLHPPTPEQFRKKVTRSHPEYTLLRARWLFYCVFPQRFPSLTQYEPVEIFGRRALAIVLDFLQGDRELERLLGYDSEMVDELREFIQEVAEFLENTGRSASVKIKVPLPTGVDPPHYTRLGERRPGSPLRNHQSPPSPQQRKAIAREKEESKKNPAIVEDDMMLRTLVRVTDIEKRQKEAIYSKQRDKFTMDVLRCEPVRRELKEGELCFKVVRFENKPNQSSMELAMLMQLRTLFSTALPKMPTEYIARLVFDDRHKNLALLKKGRGVIGGICYRQFPQLGFIEIVFCAVAASEQVKGYGTLIMDELKELHVRKDRIYHFLTFADSHAIGYFTKQGFSRHINMPKMNYVGYIKEYEGATLMGCQLHPKLHYSEFSLYMKTMRDLHQGLSDLRVPTRKRKYPGIEDVFEEKRRGDVLSLKEIPGLEGLPDKASQMEPCDDLDSKMKDIVAALKKEEEWAWPFLNPVDPEEVPEYHDYIEMPIDLATISDRIKQKYYTHERLFVADVTRMFNNCYRFNAVDTEYYKCGYKLNQVALKLLRKAFPSCIQPKLPKQAPATSASP